MPELEASFLWGGTSVGDAWRAPYTTFDFCRYLTSMARYTIAQKYGVLHNNHASYSGDLAPTNPSGTKLQIASGAALNLNILYLNDSAIDFDCYVPGYYLMSVRTSFYTQTARLYLTGPVGYGYPTPVRGFVLNDLVIALVYSDGATLTITDMRRFFRNIFAQSHYGEAAFWYIPSTAKTVRGMMMECGSIEPEALGMVANSAYEFPRNYNLATSPVTFFQPVGGAAEPDATHIASRTNNGININYDLDVTGNLAAIWFMSFGVYR